MRTSLQSALVPWGNVNCRYRMVHEKNAWKHEVESLSVSLSASLWSGSPALLSPSSGSCSGDEAPFLVGLGARAERRGVASLLLEALLLLLVLLVAAGCGDGSAGVVAKDAGRVFAAADGAGVG